MAGILRDTLVCHPPRARARLLLMAYLLCGAAIFPAHACRPIPPDPRSDALVADVIFVGTVTSVEALPPIAIGDITGDRAKLVVSRTEVIKGNAPANATVLASSACGEFLPALHERVIVIRNSGYDHVKSPGNGYERGLRKTLNKATK